MNLLITCSFCGVSRCDLDVVAVPKSMNVLLWSAAIGREALERFSGIRNPAMCREHFHISCIDTAGKLVEDAVPITLEEWQLEEINNRLNDHCYTTFHNSSEIYKISKRLLDDMKSTICMLCDREIPRKTLYVHATMHSTKPVKTECPCKYHENEKHLFHSLSKVDVERCKECRFEFRKENQTRALNRMKRCFPLFDSSTKVSTRITNFGEEKFLSVSNVPPKRYLKQREARLRIMMNSQEKVVHDGSESAPKWMNINARSSNGGEQKKKTKKAKPKAKPKKVEHENGLLNTLFPEVKQEVLDDEFQFIKQEVDDGGYGEEQPEETNFYDDDDFDLFADDDVPMVDRASDEDFNPDAGNESDSSDDAGVSNDHEEEEEEEKSVARQQTHQEKVEQNLRFAHYFKEESHPSAGKLFEISQIERKTFANCYRIFEAMRKQLGIDCQKDDSCFQIANYFVLESEQPPPPPTVDKEAEIILRDAENEALHKGLFVTSGLIYSICEKTGLHPHFVRRRMRTFLKIRRKSQKTKEMLEQWDGENKEVAIGPAWGVNIGKSSRKMRCAICLKSDDRKTMCRVSTRPKKRQEWFEALGKEFEERCRSKDGHVCKSHILYYGTPYSRLDLEEIASCCK